MLDSRKCLEIYDFCQNQYTKLEKRDKGYSPKHDKVVMEMAAKEFKMSDTLINKAFDLAAQTMKKPDASKEKSEKIIRHKLISGII